MNTKTMDFKLCLSSRFDKLTASFERGGVWRCWGGEMRRGRESDKEGKKRQGKRDNGKGEKKGGEWRKNMTGEIGRGEASAFSL